MFKCKNCNDDTMFIDAREFSNHVRKCTGLTSKEYYDKYLKKPGEGICAHPNCNNPTKFISIAAGYRNHCSYKCSNSDPIVIKQQEATCEEHFGCKRPAQSDIVMAKMQDTCMNLYGAKNGHGEEQKEAMRQQSLDKFGVEHPFQSEEIKEKCKQTKLERYGDENYTNYEKCKETMRTIYGVENCSQLDNWQEKVEQTKIIRYNDPHYNNSIKMLETKNSIATNFELENNCTLMQTIFKEYGRKWYGSKDIQIIIYKAKAYVNNDDINKIIEYENTKHSNRGTSKYERKLVKLISSIYDEQILVNYRKLISPKEIDIYLPDLRLGIEFNGTYWHSIEIGTPKDYHINKSILCRDKGIRLIHIYEFEDFDEQCTLIVDLISGIDNYYTEDFNKNNLIEHIPEPEIIYSDGHHTIYGAGKLY